MTVSLGFRSQPNNYFLRNFTRLDLKACNKEDYLRLVTISLIIVPLIVLIPHAISAQTNTALTLISTIALIVACYALASINGNNFLNIIKRYLEN